MERIPSEVVDSVLGELMTCNSAAKEEYAEVVVEFLNRSMELDTFRSLVNSLIASGPGAVPYSVALAMLMGARMEAARAESASLESLFHMKAA